MATEVRLRRGTAAQHATFTGALAEVTVNTDKKALHVHDGSTAGGNRTLMLNELGVASGVADLDSSGNIPASRLGSATAIAATRTVLKGLDTTKVKAVNLQEAGREGLFLWVTGDFSAKVTADTQEGIYIKATAIASTAGAWVRVYQGDINVKWFGAVGDGATADHVAIQAAVDLCGFLGGGIVYMPRGNFKIGASLTISKNSVTLKGAGIFATIIAQATASQDAIVIYSGGSAEVKNANISNLSIQPSVSAGRGIFVRNHWECMISDVIIWGSHTVGIDVENGAVAYNIHLRNVQVNSCTTAGLRLGASGTGDLQNVILVDCAFNAVPIGVDIQNVGGILWTGGEMLGCITCMQMRPLSGKRVNGGFISQVYFDTPTNNCLDSSIVAGSRITAMAFSDCSFNASQSGSGVVLVGLAADKTLFDNIRFVGCRFVINAKFGAYLDNCRKIGFTECSFVSNGVSDHSPGISINAGCSYVTVNGGMSGQADLFGALQNWAISITAGASNVVIDGMDVTGNIQNPPIVDDSGTSTITNCPGCKTFAKGTGTFPSGATTFTVTHGLAFTPAKEDVVLNWVSDTQGPRVWVSSVTASTFTVTSSGAMPSGWFFGWQVGVKGN